MDAFKKCDFECWIKLSEVRSTQLPSASKQYFGPYCNSAMCSFVFQLCVQLKTPSEVYMRVMEYLDRYFEHLFNNVEEAQWFTHSEQIIGDKRKNMLRLVAVIQLATKVTYRHKVLKTSEARKVLRMLGFFFLNEEILHAELKALQRLENSLSSKTLEECVDFITCIVKNNKPNFKVSHKTDLIVFVYCSAPYFLYRLEKLGFRFTSVFDFNILLGCGIVVSSFLLQEKQPEVASITINIEQLLRWKMIDILKIAYLILQHV
ncbi:uncharacterized protein DEA37_0009096 [Paragonimus westermani]|uniref:Cyclin N-terminal domain-containing protein n=1 Tax=Paragonimus westermani TaxID=34504 RepID=A0A5J4P1J3_9TREM|nr:uncharacterized protein DEA37_0009096 [Paragonimus westermani]